MRWTETVTAMWPGNSYPKPGAQRQDYTSPGVAADYRRSRTRGTGSVESLTDNVSGRPNSFSPGASAGQKRRASSPLGDDGPTLHILGSAGELYMRRKSAASWTSPNPRYKSHLGPISSRASHLGSNSYASTPPVVGSGITSMNSNGRLSPPSELSPASRDGSDLPYITCLSSNSSLRGSTSRTKNGGALSDTRSLMTSRKLFSTTNSKQVGGLKMQGIFICECCPKKPRRFDTQKELEYVTRKPHI
jgi:hypothetical protein